MTDMKHSLRTRVLLALLTAALVSGISSASAQGNWFGVRTGYPLGVTIHYGIANALSNGFDLRISGHVVAHGGQARVGLGLDAMHTIAEKSPFSVYLGAGPAIEFGAGNAWLDLHALFGGEFRFVDLGLPQLGIFAEGTLGGAIGLSDGSAEVPTFGAALGVNYHF